jgi:hypothetical protein
MHDLRVAAEAPQRKRRTMDSIHASPRFENLVEVHRPLALFAKRVRI